MPVTRMQFIVRLNNAWARVPSLRLGQLVHEALAIETSNGDRWFDGHDLDLRLYNVTDDELIKRIEAHADEFGTESG